MVESSGSMTCCWRATARHRRSSGGCPLLDTACTRAHTGGGTDRPREVWARERPRRMERTRMSGEGA
eukprot:7379260-Prymnesium_polylepis.1